MATITVLAAGFVALDGLVLTASSGFAANPEQITQYQVVLAAHPDGSLHATETISYDFGSGQLKHGIERQLPDRVSYDSTRYREYPISAITVSSPSGAPTDLKTTTTDDLKTLRIGDPDHVVTGEQTYVISYDVGGAITSFADHQELYWNAIGDQWSVPVQTARAMVTGPAAITKVACYRGVQGSADPCPATIDLATIDDVGDSASFSSRSLPAEAGMTVVASFPLGTFPGAGPILTPKPSLGRKVLNALSDAFSITPANGTSSLILIGLVGGSGLRRSRRRGRDEQFVGVPLGLTPGPGQVAEIAAVPRRQHDPVAVRFTPPDGMRPGQVGTLISGRAGPIDVTATIVDLAVRGFLRIEEVQPSGSPSSAAADWTLRQLPDPPREHLLDYESALLCALFAGRTEVPLSDLKQTFQKDLRSVRSKLSADVLAAGCFQAGPERARGWWLVGGLLLIMFGLFVTVTSFAHGRSGIFGLAMLISGGPTIALAGRRPARTALGTAFLAQAQGFRLYLEKAEANQIRFEEGQDIFSRYLPFAIIFGVAQRWATIFAALAATGAPPEAPGWYSGDAWIDFTAFGAAIDGFTSAATEALGAPSPSSSGFDGGSSGDGGGGGGGDSW